MVTNDQVNVKRMFDICVDLHMIYMLRMHWPFLIEFRIMSLRGKKHTKGDQSITSKFAAVDHDVYLLWVG